MLLHVLIVVFVLVCVFLTLFILVQSDKGGGISGAVGGGISNANSAIGAQNTENILTRGTTTLAVLYFSLAVIIFLLASGRFTKKSDASIMGAKTEITNDAAGTEVAPNSGVPVNNPVNAVQPTTGGAPVNEPSKTEGE